MNAQKLENIFFIGRSSCYVNRNEKQRRYKKVCTIILHNDVIIEKRHANELIYSNVEEKG